MKNGLGPVNISATLQPNLQPPAAKRHSRKYGSCSTNLFILEQWKTGFMVRHFDFVLTVGFEIAEKTSTTILLLKLLVVG